MSFSEKEKEHTFSKKAKVEARRSVRRNQTSQPLDFGFIACRSVAKFTSAIHTTCVGHALIWQPEK